MRKKPQEANPRGHPTGAASPVRRVRRTSDAGLAKADALRVFRRSLLARRPMTLPNLMRLCRRRLADVAADRGAAADALEAVRRFYLSGQPFGRARAR